MSAAPKLDQVRLAFHDVLVNAVHSVQFRDWSFHWHSGSVDGTEPWVQVVFAAKCPRTGERTQCHGRKWRLSVHMTKGEVVQTLLKAVLCAVEHEAREAFLYRGRAVFGPHYDVDQLHALCERGDHEDVRS